MKKEKYKEKKISEIQEGTFLFAIKNLCSSALWIKKNIDLLDDGEWDFKLKKAITFLKDDVEELSKIDLNTTNTLSYTGDLTLEKLLSEFYDFFELLDRISPLGEEESAFVISYSFLDNKIKERKEIIYPDVPLKQYFWEEVHPEIRKVSEHRYSSGHYADAVEAAFKEIIKRVKDHVNLSVTPHIDGDRAMNRAFGFENQEPLIKFNNLQSDEEKDEQRGILNLFKGIVGIRNRKAHENITLNDPLRAKEYVALASLLHRLFDEYSR